MTTPPNPPRGSSATSGRLLAAWLVVALPLAWGVAQTLFKAMALFR